MDGAAAVLIGSSLGRRTFDRGRKRLLTFTGLTFDATQAPDWGVVEEVMEAGKSAGQIRSPAQEIVANGPRGIKTAKRKALLRFLTRDLQPSPALDREGRPDVGSLTFGSRAWGRLFSSSASLASISRDDREPYQGLGNAA